MNPPHNTAVLDATDLVTQAGTAAKETDAKQKKSDEKVWPYIHAPDALSARSVSVPRRGLRRELKIFLTNPNAIVGLLFLATVLIAAVTAPLIYPGDPLEMVARPSSGPARTRPIRSAPIPWAGMCWRASCTARASRSPSVSSPL